MGDQQPEPDPVESEDSKERSFVHWQDKSLEQLGYAVNLILALSMASLGFALSLVKDKNFTPSCWGKAFLVFSLLLLIFSVGLGVWCVLNRLLSFRHTTKAAKTRETRDKLEHQLTKRPQEGAGHSGYTIASMEKTEAARLELLNNRLVKERAAYGALDKRTWMLLWFHIAAFGLGVLFLIASFVAVYHGTLF